MVFDDGFHELIFSISVLDNVNYFGGHKWKPLNDFNGQDWFLNSDHLLNMVKYIAMFDFWKKILYLKMKKCVTKQDIPKIIKKWFDFSLERL